MLLEKSGTKIRTNSNIKTPDAELGDLETVLRFQFEALLKATLEDCPIGFADFKIQIVTVPMEVESCLKKN